LSGPVFLFWCLLLGAFFCPSSGEHLFGTGPSRSCCSVGAPPHECPTATKKRLGPGPGHLFPRHPHRAHLTPEACLRSSPDLCHVEDSCNCSGYCGGMEGCGSLFGGQGGSATSPDARARPRGQFAPATRALWPCPQHHGWPFRPAGSGRPGQPRVVPDRGFPDLLRPGAERSTAFRLDILALRLKRPCVKPARGSSPRVDLGPMLSAHMALLYSGRGQLFL
jgi:hypothetical protein